MQHGWPCNRHSRPPCGHDWDPRGTPREEEHDVLASAPRAMEWGVGTPTAVAKRGWCDIDDAIFKNFGVGFDNRVAKHAIRADPYAIT